VLGGETAVIPTQRALAAAVGDHIGQVQRAANLPFFPSSFQWETHASALISRGQPPSSLDGEHARSSSFVQAARLSFANIFGFDVAQGYLNTVAQDGASGYLFERQGPAHPPPPSLATPVEMSVVRPPPPSLAHPRALSLALLSHPSLRQPPPPSLSQPPPVVTPPTPATVSLPVHP